METGGIELIEQGAKHGDDLWRLASKYPQASRTLALHGDDLLPLIRKAGPEVLEFEVRNPGLVKRAIHAFGDDTAKRLVKVPSQEDVPVLSGMQKKKYSRSRGDCRDCSARDHQLVFISGGPMDLEETVQTHCTPSHIEPPTAG